MLIHNVNVLSVIFKNHFEKMLVDTTVFAIGV